MKELGAKVAVMCVVVLLASSAFGLEIQLGPRTLVLSSGGDQLTIHTDFPFAAVDGVTLDIGGTLVSEVAIWEDDCGYLVARCSKEAVEEVVGNDFEGRFTTVGVTLAVESDILGADSATETLRVRK